MGLKGKLISIQPLKCIFLRLEKRSSPPGLSPYSFPASSILSAIDCPYPRGQATKTADMSPSFLLCQVFFKGHALVVLLSTRLYNARNDYLGDENSVMGTAPFFGW